MSYPLCRFTGNAFNSLFHLGFCDVRRLVKHPTQRTCWYRMFPWTQLAMKLGFGPQRYPLFLVIDEFNGMAACSSKSEVHSTVDAA